MKYRIPYLIFVLGLLIACENNPLEVDVSSVEVELNLLRVDSILNSDKSIKGVIENHNKLTELGGELYTYYTSEMIQVGHPGQDSVSVFLSRFLNDSSMTLIQNNIDVKFNNFQNEFKAIKDGFKHLKFHIPHAIIPKEIVLYNSTFSNSVISSDEQLGIGLEMYLGENDPIIQEVGFPAYFKAKMTSEYLLPNVAQSWLQTNVIEDQKGDTFLSNLIYYGKLLYTIKAMLPNLADHVILRYNKDEFEWAEISEFDVWKYLVEQKWVFSTETKLMVRYFNPGPTTVGLEGSPSKIGQYLGWKIINSYMKKNPEVTIQNLISETNHTKILKAYKPK